MFNTLDQQKLSELENMVNSKQLDVLIGLHAFHSGCHLVKYRSRVPYFIIIGGTDANVMVHDPSRKRVMTEALAHARAIVCFTVALQSQIREHFPQLCPSNFSIAPSSSLSSPFISNVLDNSVLKECGFSLSPSSSPSDLSSSFAALPSVALIPQAAECVDADCRVSLHSRVGCGSHDRIFLLPAGIRAVKDPEFVVGVMQDWHQKDPSVWLAIVGPQLELEAVARLDTRLAERAGVCYLGTVSAEELHGYMKQSVATINTSVNEGMCGALLEAMLLSCPVLARRNGGNEAIIQHGVTGYLFSSPEEFLAIASQLLAVSSCPASALDCPKAINAHSFSPISPIDTEGKMGQTLKRRRLCGPDQTSYKSLKTGADCHSMASLGSSRALQQLLCKARSYVQTVHSLTGETQAYDKLVRSFFSNSTNSGM